MPSETRTCQNCQVKFDIDTDDLGFYERIGVPPPTLCFQCRLQRRMLFRNERNLYRRSCNLCGEKVISVYTDQAPFPVYCHKCWWSDKWDPTSYGMDFDFNKPFFKQFNELSQKVPALSLMNDNGVGSVNCEYTYDWAFSKNVYMSACGWHVENGLYLYGADYDKDVMDCVWTNKSELMYETVNCDNCYGCKYCVLCFDSRNCTFGYDLKGCSDCVMSVGLRNKSCCIRNVQYSREEYIQKLKEMRLEDRTELDHLREEFQSFALKFPRKYAYNLKTVASTGDILFETKASKDCFYVLGPTENSRFIFINDRAKDCYDCNNTGNPELCYESVTPDNSRGNKFSIFCWKCSEAEYSNNCHSCVGIFGCAALKQKSYAILNKAYSKEEFTDLRAKIIEHMKKTGEWGEFFSPELSPFSYNETQAQEWFPLEEKSALARGYKWKPEKERSHAVTKKASEVPATIQDTPDDFVQEIVECAHGGQCKDRCTSAFRVTPQELQLYRKMKTPIPFLCPNCRHYRRLSLGNPPRLWERQCTCAGSGSENGIYANTVAHAHGDKACGNKFQTAYAPDRREIVYCEQCYQAEVA